MMTYSQGRGCGDVSSAWPAPASVWGRPCPAGSQGHPGLPNKVASSVRVKVTPFSALDAQCLSASLHRVDSWSLRCHVQNYLTRTFLEGAPEWLCWSSLCLRLRA